MRTTKHWKNCRAGFPKLTPTLIFPDDRSLPSSVTGPLSIAYSRLRSVSQGSTGDKSKWKILSDKWFDSLASETSQVHFPNIEMSEAPLSSATVELAFWLSSQIRQFRDRPSYYKGFQKHEGALRRFRMFSYKSANEIDLEFYDFHICQIELMLLAEGKIYGKIDPLLKCLIRYAHFTAIHPFADGNGRVSRILLTTQLEDACLWNSLPLPIGFLLHRDRINYIRNIREALLLNKWNNYFIYMLNVISAACELSALVRYVHADSYNA